MFSLCWFVCLVTRSLEKLYSWIFLGGIGFGTRNSRLVFFWGGGWLQSAFWSRSRNWLLFLIRLFATSYRPDNSATLLLFAKTSQHYDADDFSDEPDFNIVYQCNQFNTCGTNTYSLAGYALQWVPFCLRNISSDFLVCFVSVIYIIMACLSLLFYWKPW